MQVLPLPLLLVFVFAGIVFCLAKLLFRKTERASIITWFVLFSTLSYSRILELFKNASFKIGGIKVEIEQILPVTIVIILGVIIYLIFRYKQYLLGTNKTLAVFSVSLLIIPLFTIFSYEIQTGRLLSSTIDNGIQSGTVSVVGDRPDIYYFIFDRYAGPRSLKEQYNFDNSTFYDFLKKKGFYVAEESTTNYPKTFLSLTASLNMEYVDFLTKKTNGGASGDESIATPFIRNNKALAFLKERGYRYINVGSWWTPTKLNKNADSNYYFKNDAYVGADEFTTGFLNTTIASPMLKDIFRDPTAVSKDPFNNNHRSNILYEFNALKQIPHMSGPKFIFAHILIPHDPFVFDKNCNPISETIVNKHGHVENYLEQLQCANTKIMTMINDILRDSKTPPIIILQSDEGPFPMIGSLSSNESWSTTSDVSLHEKFPILNAYYLPGASTDALYQTITPVNSFRVVFNTYFKTDYPLLKDKNYIFQDDDNHYIFIDITEKIKQ